MSEINSQNSAYNLKTGTPLYNYASNVSPVPVQTVNASQTPVQSNITSPIYQYPTTSLYAPNTSQSLQNVQSAQTASTPSVKDASGVNIYIYNPAGFSGQSSSSAAGATYGMPNCGNCTQTPQPVQPQVQQQNPIANTPIAGENNVSETPKKTKKVVKLTDDYIKTLESYLRSNDSSVRKMGVQELIKRFEEDGSRYEDEALTALLNIALQDKDASNRMLAMSAVAGSSAHGDANTVALLQKLQQSDKIYGQEAKMATEALLKASQTMATVPDDSPEVQNKSAKNQE